MTQPGKKGPRRPRQRTLPPPCMPSRERRLPPRVIPLPPTPVARPQTARPNDPVGDWLFSERLETPRCPACRMVLRFQVDCQGAFFRCLCAGKKHRLP